MKIKRKGQKTKYRKNKTKNQTIQIKLFFFLM